MRQLHQWLGNLFSRGVSPVELMGMSYHELKYWNEWHTVMDEQERKSAERAKSGRGR